MCVCVSCVCVLYIIHRSGYENLPRLTRDYNIEDISLISTTNLLTFKPYINNMKIHKNMYLHSFLLIIIK